MAGQYTQLKCKAVRIGLKVNVSKTKYMLANGTDRVGSRVTIDGEEFEVVEECSYLGSMITADNDNSREIRRRITNGSRTYYGLHGNLRSRKFHPRTECSMYNTLIWPVVFSTGTKLGLCFKKTCALSNEEC